MTQAQHTHTGTMTMPAAALVALAAAAALAIALAFTGTITLPAIQTDAGVKSDQATVDAGRAWERQQEQQAGQGIVSPDVMDAARDWESQRKAQSGNQPRVTDPTEAFLEKVREARGY